MRALITGSSGFVAEHLISKLWEHNEVFYFDIRNSPEQDIRKYEDVRNALIAVEPDAIFHLAAVSWPGESFADPQLTMETNTLGTMNVLEAARKTGFEGSILLAGTSEEYGYNTEQFLDEDCTPRPTTPYGVSKLAATSLGMAYAGKYGMHIVATRAFNHTGPGRQAVNAESAFARRIVAVERGLAEKVPHGRLDTMRNFTDVRDVVQAYIRVVDAEPGIYNICSDQNVTIWEIMKTLLEISGLDKDVLEPDSRFQHVGPPALFPTPQKTKIEAATGWVPTIPLRKTLEDLLNYWRER